MLISIPVYDCFYFMYVLCVRLHFLTVYRLHVRTNIRNIRTFPELPDHLYVGTQHRNIGR